MRLWRQGLYFRIWFNCTCFFINRRQGLQPLTGFYSSRFVLLKCLFNPDGGYQPRGRLIEMVFIFT